MDVGGYLASRAAFGVSFDAGMLTVREHATGAADTLVNTEFLSFTDAWIEGRSRTIRLAR